MLYNHSSLDIFVIYSSLSRQSVLKIPTRIWYAGSGSGVSPDATRLCGELTARRKHFSFWVTQSPFLIAPVRERSGATFSHDMWLTIIKNMNLGRIRLVNVYCV